MAKDMGRIYGEMLTKELVALRKRHSAKIAELANINSRSARAECERLSDLLAQVNEELASRVANFNLFV